MVKRGAFQHSFLDPFKHLLAATLHIVLGPGSGEVRQKPCPQGADSPVGRPESEYILIRCDKCNNRNLYKVLWENNSFTQQIFPEHLLYAMYHSRQWGYDRDRMRPNL